MADATADSLFKTIHSFFEKHQIPFKNMIGFAGDNAAVMMGNYKGLKAKLQQVSPNLFVLGCICHSLHLCCSSACLKLPKVVEDLCRDIYNYICHSPKRMNEFKQFQEFVNIQPHRILRPSQTRWLSLQCVVDRILEQWDAHVLYFQGAALEDHLESAEKIYGALLNPVYKIYFSFLSHILPVVTKMNKEFQSEGVQIHHAFEKVCALYRSVLSNYMKREVLNTQDIFTVNPHDPSNFLSETDIYYGTKVQRLILEAGSTVETSLVSGFRVKCLNFYVELATQIRKRFMGINKVMPLLTALDPKTAINQTMRDLTDLLDAFPNLVPEPQHDAVNDEWRNLPFHTTKIQETSDPVQFWYKVRALEYADKSQVFPHLSDFMLSLLVLPHSTATVERIFSQVNLIKTDRRNRLNAESVNGIMLTKMVGGTKPCYEWVPSLKMLHSASKFKSDKEEKTD